MYDVNVRVVLLKTHCFDADSGRCLQDVCHRSSTVNVNAVMAVNYVEMSVTTFRDI